MAYLVPADFRAGTIHEACYGLALSTAEAPNAELTAAIARLSERIDGYTADHFEPEDGITLDLDVRAPKATRVYLPRRVRAVSSVQTREGDGTFTTEVSSAYRVRSSFIGAGHADYDFVEVVEGGPGLTVGDVWPVGTDTVRVTGDFSWASTPGDIKRALALLVYDHFKPLRKDLRRSSRWADQSATYEIALSEPTGIPEADEIIAAYQRPEPPVM